MVTQVSTDDLVVGADSMGMAFTDAPIDHADEHITGVAPGDERIRGCARRTCGRLPQAEPVGQRRSDPDTAPIGDTWSMAHVVVRPAVRGDLAVLREIERDAGQRYREYGLGPVADDDPPSIEVLWDYVAAGRAWAAVDDADEPIGYILVDEIDGAAHIEQVTVARGHQGQGRGRAMIEQAGAWAITKNLTALTLTAFGHIPWNRPLYEHLGFRVLSLEEIGLGLQAQRRAEAEHGLDPELRVVMRLDLHT